MSPTVRNVLLGVRWLLDAPARWTQGTWGRSQTGEAVPLPGCDSHLSCVCLMAAIDLVEACGSCTATAAALYKDIPNAFQTPNAPRVTIQKWNDAETRTHADVLALLDRVLAGAA